MGMSDTTIFVYIVAILILTNFISAFISAEYSTTSSQYDVDGVLDDATNDVENLSEANAFNVIKAVSGIFLWSFGLLPAWLDVVFTVLRVIGYIIVAKWVRGVSS